MGYGWTWGHHGVERHGEQVWQHDQVYGGRVPRLGWTLLDPGLMALLRVWLCWPPSWLASVTSQFGDLIPFFFLIVGCQGQLSTWSAGQCYWLVWLLCYLFFRVSFSNPPYFFSGSFSEVFILLFQDTRFHPACSRALTLRHWRQVSPSLLRILLILAFLLDYLCSPNLDTSIFRQLSLLTSHSNALSLYIAYYFFFFVGLSLNLTYLYAR